MTRERFVPMGGIDRDGMRLVRSGGGRAAVTGTAAHTLGTASQPTKSGYCTVIHLPMERTRFAHIGPAGDNPHRTADPGSSPSIERGTNRRTGRTRHYVEALVGWLLIFGTAYLALLLIGE